MFFVGANRASDRILGVSNEQFMGKTIEEAFPGLIETEVPVRYREVAKTGKIWRTEQINYEEGRISGAFEVVAFQTEPNKMAALFNEITTRKQAEEALRESEEKYRLLIENANDAILILQDEQVKFFNPSALKLTRYSEDEFQDMNIMRFIHPLDRNTVIDRYRRRIKGEDVPSTYECRLINKQGERIWAQVNAVRTLWEEREATLTFLRDITQQKQAEKQLQQAQKMESIGNLAGGIAHDFNNILFPIVGMSEMLMEDLPANSPVYESARHIFKAAMRGSDLVKQILAFSRQSDHKMIPIRIQQILKDILELSRSTIPSYIEITHDIQNNCGLLMADPIQLHQIAMNLITNAYHAIEPSSGKICIQLKEIKLSGKDLNKLSIEPGRFAALTISDTGTGIEPEITDRIFDPYFTTKEKGKGTGLGLAVVYGIVKEHGGDINVDSEAGKGTTFTIYLPLIKGTVEKASVEKATILPAGHERILLVDDEEEIIYLEKQMLERLGYQISFRTSSVDALEAFKANPDTFDLVITDMTMPNMTGDQLAKELISIKPDIPIILCTGFSEWIDREKSEAIGIKGFLMKPVVLNKIAKMVRNVLDKAKVSE